MTLAQRGIILGEIIILSPRLT